MLSLIKDLASLLLSHAITPILKRIEGLFKENHLENMKSFTRTSVEPDLADSSTN